MNKTGNRMIYAIAGVAVMLFAGIVYGWSVLSTPIAAEFSSWTRAQLSLIFTVTMCGFCLGCSLGGMLARKISGRSLLLLSAVMFLAGFFFSASVTAFIQMLLAFGIILGTASGISYNAVIGTVSKWFPDKSGFISGVLLMGFGIGNFIIGKVYTALTPAVTGAWRGSFRILGIIVAVVFAVCALFIISPPADFAPASARKKVQITFHFRLHVGPDKIIKTPCFWSVYFWSVFVSAAGLILVSQGSGIAREAVSGISSGSVATLVGMISVFNGIGRVFAGIVYDIFGHHKFNMMFVVLGFTLSAVLNLGAIAAGSNILLTAGFLIGGMAYGFVTPTISAVIRAFYGGEYYSLNLSVINTNLLIASFASTIAGMLYDRTGSFASCILLIVACAGAGAVCYFIKRAIMLKDATLYEETITEDELLAIARSHGAKAFQ